MNYFIGEFLGSKIIIVVKTVIVFRPFAIPVDPLWGPVDRPVWDSLMNYFIGEFLGLKIMIVLKTVITFHLSEILRGPPLGAAGSYLSGFPNELFSLGNS